MFYPSLRKSSIVIFYCCLVAILLYSCNRERKDIKETPNVVIEDFPDTFKDKIERENDTLAKSSVIVVEQDILVRDYFNWMDSIGIIYGDSALGLPFEYLLVHHNPWIMMNLWKTDYYYLAENGIFIDDPKEQVALFKGDIVSVPNSDQSSKILEDLKNTILDLNIPEFVIKIQQYDSVKYRFVVRVGKNDQQYLAMADQVVDMRTKKGGGSIVKVVKKPDFINPKDNKPYHVTRRDDNRTTGLPNIPWLEPEISGVRHGQLIHPTTNIKTLGKASSNGCIGLREGDAWIIYYFAPVGTRINIRYDLEIENEMGEKVNLMDIYNGYRPFKKVEDLNADIQTSIGLIRPLCSCI